MTRVHMINRTEAEDALRPLCSQYGVFVLRKSYRQNVPYCISVTHDGLIRHFQVYHDPLDDTYRISKRRFETVEKLITAYRTHTLKSSTKSAVSASSYKPVLLLTPFDERDPPPLAPKRSQQRLLHRIPPSTSSKQPPVVPCRSVSLHCTPYQHQRRPTNGPPFPPRAKVIVENVRDSISCSSSTEVSLMNTALPMDIVPPPVASSHFDRNINEIPACSSSPIPDSFNGLDPTFELSQLLSAMEPHISPYSLTSKTKDEPISPSPRPAPRQPPIPPSPVPPAPPMATMQVTKPMDILDGPNNRQGLLSSIQMHKAESLRKVHVEEKKSSCSASDSGIVNALAARIANRRKAVDDDEDFEEASDDEDEWSD